MKTDFRKKIGIGCIVIVGCAIAAFFWKELFFENKSPIEKLESGSFTIKGESVFFGEEKTSCCPVEEVHDGDNYYIDRMNRTYIKEDNQYYIDNGDGKTAVYELPEDLAGIEEMFDRKSEISNLSFSSDCVRSCEYPSNIPTITGEKIDCICVEYQTIKEDMPPIRLYLLNGELYAIQSRDDDRFIFYVESLT